MPVGVEKCERWREELVVHEVREVQCEWVRSGSEGPRE